MDAEADTLESTQSIRTMEMQNSGWSTIEMFFGQSTSFSFYGFPQIPPEDRACNIARSCKLQARAVRGDRYLHTCTECPQVYPWIKNEFGLDI